MNALADQLAGQFVAFNLGAAGDADCGLPAQILKALTLVEIDAVAGADTSGRYYAKHVVKQVVAGMHGRRLFYETQYPHVSSLLRPREEHVRRYGLAQPFAIVATHEVECVALPEIARELGITHVDLLKTDLEGADFEVIRGSGALLDSMLCIQCEVRFESLYEGEPCFHEMAAFLQSRGFELLDLADIDRWKPATSRRSRHHDGRIVTADAVFMRPASHVEGLPEAARPVALAKQVLAAVMVGQRSHGEWLLETHRALLPLEVAGDLNALVRPRRRWRDCFAWTAAKFLAWHHAKALLRPLLRRPHNDASHTAETFTYQA